ncbi:MAG: NAD(P)H-hydrate dehydratase [Nitrospirae bacterium]|nr:NAD(P)H-hydrate dehydratase [Nitrospirota bacterium]MCL5421805.1 NAD(P)H-hydrate dehydratase [Nitrospirota bacterium]
MKVVTAQEMQEIDRKTIQKFRVPSHVLMERAGVAVAKRAQELFERKKTIVLAGGGSNGGDGLVVARELFNAQWNVKVLLLIKEDKLSPDCLLQLRIAKRMGVPVEFRTGITEEDLHGAVVVDAMLGTGLNKDIEGAMARVLTFLNDSGSPVISVDIPSGISSDSGQVMGVAVKAAYTVTFGLPKRGHLLYPGADYTGRLFIENIGFPGDLLTSGDLKVELLEKSTLSHLVPERPKYSHKGDYGHVLIVAGSKGKTGAAFMAAKACLRTGAGLVTIGVPESLMDVFQSRVTEEMTLPLPDRGDGTLSSKSTDTILRFLAEKADVLCIGPGIGVSDETRMLMAEIILSSRAPLVVDADGINSLSDPRGKGQEAREILKKALAPVILTPHPGEMARLLQSAGGKVQGEKESQSDIAASRLRNEIEKDRISTAIRFSKETGTYLIFKGVPTIVAEPEGRAFINSTGNPGMATAGIGDVLTGMVSSFLAQGMNPLNSAILGVFMHGLAGDLAAHEKGMHSLIASDIIDALPATFQEMTG